MGYHYHLTDWLGTERVQINASGNAEETCTSYSFGDGLTCSGTSQDATEQHFTGKEHDAESGLDYFGARYFASTQGRFMTPDWAASPISVPYADFGDPQSLSLYAYAGNNPNTKIDLDGHVESASNAVLVNEDQANTEEAGQASEGQSSEGVESSGPAQHSKKPKPPKPAPGPKPVPAPKPPPLPQPPVNPTPPNPTPQPAPAKTDPAQTQKPADSTSPTNPPPTNQSQPPKPELPHDPCPYYQRKAAIGYGASGAAIFFNPIAGTIAMIGVAANLSNDMEHGNCTDGASMDATSFVQHTY